MKKLLFVFFLNIGLSSIVLAQCDNFPYFIIEISGSANEVYFSSVELNQVCLKITDLDDFVEIKEELEKAVGISKDIKNNLGFVEVAIENAQANAENCYCINGQEVVYEIEQKYDSAFHYSNELLKLLKSAEKSKNLEQIKQYIDSSLRSIPKLQESVDDIVKLASDGMDKCN